MEKGIDLLDAASITFKTSFSQNLVFQKWAQVNAGFLGRAAFEVSCIEYDADLS